MTKVIEITKPFLREAREEMEAALKEFGEKYGLTITVGSASFMPGPGGNATFKVELATQTDDGEANTRRAADFKRYAPMYGFKPEHLFGEFTYAGTRYKLVGFSPKASRFPLIVERVPDGKAFKMPLEAAASLKDKK